MPRVVHFEIHAADPDRAMAFYGKVFGWTFEKYQGPMDYWLINTGPHDEAGIDGGLIRRMGPSPDPSLPAPVTSYVCTIDVEDIDETASAIVAEGGLLAVPKMPIPGLAWLAYYKDTDGNIFGIYQADQNAR